MVTFDISCDDSCLPHEFGVSISCLRYMYCCKMYTPIHLSWTLALISTCLEVEAFSDSGSTYDGNELCSQLIGIAASSLGQMLLQYR